jgi:2-oxoglutarate dehydrogenase E2 component (dihydrolipoamide succinyltransferase)
MYSRSIALHLRFVSCISNRFNQPQVAILSTDAIVKKPVVISVPGGGESIAIHPVGNLAMAWDHRAFDGAYAAGFLVRVKNILETRDWSSEL